MSRHYRPETPPSFPIGLVYVGHWTRNVHRMRENTAETARGALILYRQPRGWLDGQHRHRQAEHITGCSMMHHQGGDYDRDCAGCMSMLIIDRLRGFRA